MGCRRSTGKGGQPEGDGFHGGFDRLRGAVAEAAQPFHGGFDQLLGGAGSGADADVL